MKNFIQPGASLVVIAPRDVVAGDGVLVGSMFGVAKAAAKSGDEVVIDLEGVFSMAKAPSQAWTVGVRVYWDNANFRTTSAASGNTLIGVAVEAVAAGADNVLGPVRLNGSF